MVTINQKPTTNTQKRQRKENNITLTKIVELQGKKLRKEEKNRDELQKQPENKYKMAISIYLSIITLNANRLMLQSKDLS